MEEVGCFFAETYWRLSAPKSRDRLPIAISQGKATHPKKNSHPNKGGDLSPTTSAWFPPGNSSRVANLVGLVSRATLHPCVYVYVR